MLKTSENRNSNIEWLRIIAMLFIVSSHFSYHSDFPISSVPFSINKSWLLVLSCGGTFGVNLFILISCFYDSKKVKISKILQTWEIMLFYSVLSYAISVVVNGFSAKGLITSLLPFTFTQWWFATCYLLYLCTLPALRMLVDSLDQKQHLCLVAGVLLLYYVIPSALLDQAQYVNSLGRYFQFVALYFIAQYLKKYRSKIFDNNSLHLLTGIGFYVMIGVINIAISFVAYYFGKNGRYGMPNNIFLLCSTVFLFLWAYNLKPKQNKVVNLVAGTTFGIYLLHDNAVVREILWGNMPKICEMETSFFILKSIGIICIIFMLAMMVELIRKVIFSKMLGRLNQTLENFVKKVADKAFAFFYEIAA